ncbi:hypothetical protein J7M22_05455 [Candidatus Poribacteria bacterium]|nr:hypothetical protein [Candidatus Poribacteria bacterium]
MKRHIALILTASILVLALTLGCSHIRKTRIGRSEPELIPDVKLEELLPQSLNGWSSVKSSLYTPENLYEYIDGEAEAFLAFDFRSLLSTTYSRNGSGEITVDIYDMKSPKNAFGIYSSLRYGDLNYVDIGNQGFLTKDELDFWKGRFFVKVIDFTTDGSAEMIPRFEKFIASKIPDPTTEEYLIRLLPKEGLVPNSAKFILKNMLGQSFLSNGFMAEYRIDGEECQFFYSEQESDEAAKKAFEMYRSTFPNASPTPREIGDESFIGNDPYYKTVIAFRKGRFLGAVLKSPGMEEGIKLIKAFLSNAITR